MAKSKKVNKSAIIRKLYDEGKTVKEIREKVKCSDGLVRLVIRNYKNKLKKDARYKKPKSDPKAEAWKKNNPWFGVDERKTAYALGLHEKLVNSGVDATSDEYYKKIDKGMSEFNKPKKKAQFKSPRSRLIQEIFQTKKALDAGGVDDSGTEIKFDETGMMKEGTKVGGLTLRKLPGDLWTWKKETEADPVNHPPHYTKGGIETIDFIEAKDLNYRLGNVVKYVARAGKKDSDPVQDLEKAAWYLQREILARKQA